MVFVSVKKSGQLSAINTFQLLIIGFALVLTH